MYKCKNVKYVLCCKILCKNLYIHGQRDNTQSNYKWLEIKRGSISETFHNKKGCITRYRTMKPNG